MMQQQLKIISNMTTSVILIAEGSKITDITPKGLKTEFEVKEEPK